MFQLEEIKYAPITMTSLELVDFINSQRGEGEAVLRHDHFMAKVPKVLGEDHAPRFRGMVRVAIGSGAHRPSQNHADAGRFIVKTGVAPNTEKAYTTTKFTPKGINWIAGEWGKYKLAMGQA